jgi:hypothetical protein
VKLFIWKIYRHILDIKKDRNPQALDYMPGMGQVVTGLRLSSPREKQFHGVGLSPLGTSATILAYCTSPEWEMRSVKQSVEW